MDVAQLANEVVTKVAPFFPALIGGAAEGLAQRIPEGISRLWHTITAKFKGRPAAETAIADLAKEPNDPDNLAALRKEVRKVLAEDAQTAQLVADIIAALPKTFEASPVQIVKGNVVGGNMTVEQKTDIRK